jgi:hypothetical protein
MIALLFLTPFLLGHGEFSLALDAKQYDAENPVETEKDSGDAISPFLVTVSPFFPNCDSTAEIAKGKHKNHQGEEEGTEFWPPFLGYRLKVTDTLLAVFTGLLFVATWLLWRSTDALVRDANRSADRQARDTQEQLVIAKQSAETSREALVKSQRAFVRALGYPWLWRPDFDRPGKYLFDIAPLIENAGSTPTVDMTIITDYALRDTPVPDGFAFPYRDQPGNTLIGPKQTIGANHAIILDEDLLAVQNGTKFFYIWGTVIYRDVFYGTPDHTTEFCTQITRVLGNPLDPRNPKGTSVEIAHPSSSSRTTSFC